MKSITLALAVVGLGFLGGGCATVTTGTTQPINIDSDPAGAECTLMRGGAQLSTVTTPAPVTVKRDSQTIHVRCKKEGYEEGLVVMNSRFEAMTVGNVLVGGLVGVIVDASTGANSKYDPYVMVRMAALSPADAAVAAARPRSPPTPPPAAPVETAVAVVPAAPTPVAPTPVAASTVAAIAPAVPTVDGTYVGTLTINRTAGGSAFLSVTLAVSGGSASGQVSDRLCGAWPLNVTLSPSGQISGSVRTLDGAPQACTTEVYDVSGKLSGGAIELEVSRPAAKGKASLKKG